MHLHFQKSQFSFLSSAQMKAKPYLLRITSVPYDTQHNNYNANVRRNCLGQILFGRDLIILALLIKVNNRNTSRDGSRTATASKMERFVIIVNGRKSLSIITKHSILDVVAVLDPPLTRRSYETCSKLTITAPERRQNTPLQISLVLASLNFFFYF